ncbi:skin secretory protein xP2-like [Neopsephotus bourkii]|uniref:skin secretory protein xP2-like n=1 Tax=Neopsephotus bourkii TaxID=309878 RepID=UPI002AA53C02|nr:skin secretory protein xP2-like [Neopsephotus bourkii]
MGGTAQPPVRKQEGRELQGQQEEVRITPVNATRGGEAAAGNGLFPPAPLRWGTEPGPEPGGSRSTPGSAGAAAQAGGLSPALGALRPARARAGVRGLARGCFPTVRGRGLRTSGAAQNPSGNAPPPQAARAPTAPHSTPTAGPLCESTRAPAPCNCPHREPSANTHPCPRVPMAPRHMDPGRPQLPVPGPSSQRPAPAPSARPQLPALGPSSQCPAPAGLGSLLPSPHPGGAGTTPGPGPRQAPEGSQTRLRLPAPARVFHPSPLATGTPRGFPSAPAPRALYGDAGAALTLLLEVSPAPWLCRGSCSGAPWCLPQQR